MGLWVDGRSPNRISTSHTNVERFRYECMYLNSIRKFKSSSIPDIMAESHPGSRGDCRLLARKMLDVSCVCLQGTVTLSAYITNHMYWCYLGQLSIKLSHYSTPAMTAARSASASVLYSGRYI